MLATLDGFIDCENRSDFRMETLCHELCMLGLLFRYNYISFFYNSTDAHKFRTYQNSTNSSVLSFLMVAKFH
jgi:hypothetical protein